MREREREKSGRCYMVCADRGCSDAVTWKPRINWINWLQRTARLDSNPMISALNSSDVDIGGSRWLSNPRPLRRPGMLMGARVGRNDFESGRESARLDQSIRSEKTPWKLVELNPSERIGTGLHPSNGIQRHDEAMLHQSWIEMGSSWLTSSSVSISYSRN